MSSPDAVIQTFELALSAFGDAIASKDPVKIADLFLPDGWLRDILISDWDYASVPKDSLTQFLSQKGVPEIDPATLKLDPERSSPQYDKATDWIIGFYIFETPITHGHGVARLKRDPNDTYKIFTASLILSSFKPFPELARTRRPFGTSHDPSNPRTLNWLEERDLTSSFTNAQPDVIIVGAGHGGLMLAARLKRLGLKALLVDRQERLGDSWRKRYHSLVLHDSIWTNGFPYLAFPDDWPVFIPKDKIAGWFESYASIMELNVWLESTVEKDSVSYDESAGMWTLKITRGDGSTREMHCRHIVQATGHSGEPRVPKFEGMSDFEGTVVHSSGHKGGEAWRGKKAVVVGSCNSGHDISQNLYHCGADITMVQRSATLVTRSMSLFKALGHHEGSPPIDEADLVTVSFPLLAFEPYAVEMHKWINEEDRDLLAGLERAGFKIKGKGGPGLFYLYWREGGGYYIDVGCSSLIVDGKVKIKQGVGVKKFESDGVRFEDDSFLPADLVVLATGYDSMRETCRKIFGAKVADRTRSVWGVDSQGEIKGIWRRSGHPGFWYMGGNFALARMYSKYLALQIKAIEEGLMPRVGSEE